MRSDKSCKSLKESPMKLVCSDLYADTFWKKSYTAKRAAWDVAQTLSMME